jgi:hypothetical protein
MGEHVASFCLVSLVVLPWTRAQVFVNHLFQAYDSLTATEFAISVLFRAGLALRSTDWDRNATSWSGPFKRNSCRIGDASGSVASLPSTPGVTSHDQICGLDLNQGDVNAEFFERRNC